MDESKIYEQIARVIEAANSNFKGRPNLAELAEQLNLSQERLELLFKEFAGVSVDEFFKVVSIGNTVNILRPKEKTLFSAPESIQIENRLHRIDIEKMTAPEYQNSGTALVITYSFSTSHFGKLLLASTTRGICYLAFYDDESVALKLLCAKFPQASYQEQSNLFQENALAMFKPNGLAIKRVQLHLKGTDFQLKVWRELLEIRKGKLTTYGEIAKALGNPNASRAVGTAIGQNPIAFLIPCHRVIQATGNFGGYMWGTMRKKAMIGWEQASLRRQEPGVRNQ